jgi:pyruvate,water dikinase
MPEEGGLVEVEALPEQRRQSSLPEEVMRMLVDYAYIVEYHYGTPQDIEWAMDANGDLYLLQTRPLNVVAPSLAVKRDVDVSGLTRLHEGGVTVCPGAGAGRVFHAGHAGDLQYVPENAVVVTRNPIPGLVTVMQKVRAIVTEVGSIASHMAALAREARVPCVVGMEDAVSMLKADTWVTVDATEGVIYEGVQDEVVEARRPDYDDFEDMPIYYLLRQLLAKISPLNLINTDDTETFSIKGIRTFHDMIRYCHQKSIEEVFNWMRSVQDKKRIAFTLKSEIPLEVNLIYLDPEIVKLRLDRKVDEHHIGSEPMQAFWNGVLHEGWPHRKPPADFRGISSVWATHGDQDEDFVESSYAFVGREYMLVHLRLGYHFTTVEAMCTDEISKNYVRLEHKGGGASRDRRRRRVNLIQQLLAPLGFDPESRGDFLETMVSYDRKEKLYECLEVLGRLTMVTKQLDMALTNDRIMEWYRKDLAKRLGLDERDPKT